MNSKRNKMIGVAVGVFLSVGAFAFEYNVTKPAIRPRWSGAVAGEWTMDYKAALEKAQNAPSPVTNFSLFKDGKLLTHEIQNEKKFLALAGK